MVEIIFYLAERFIVEALWERLKLGPTLRKAMEESGGSDLHEGALLAMTANRLCDPDSKLGVWDRQLQKVYLPSCSGVKLYQMYEALDLPHWNVRSGEDAESIYKVGYLFNQKVKRGNESRAKSQNGPKIQRVLKSSLYLS